jgi:hypothetical protein
VTPHERELYEALDGLPLVRRLALILSNIVVDDKAARSVEFIVEVALIMAKHLPEPERARIVWHLMAAAEELKVCARWN